MFGYIVVNKPEMKFREFDVYHAFYCGLCRSLQRQYGITGELTLTYDMTFVALLLTGVYEPETVIETKRCVVHPLHKQQMASNTFLDYAADMNVLSFYEKCRDDWNDEKKWTRKAMAGLLKNAYQKVTEKYPQKTEKILTCLEQIYQAEKKNELDIDKMSGYYGEVMAEVFACYPDVWEESLRKMGFFMGKFIYLMDAFDDVEEDLKNQTYNPLKQAFMQDPENFDENCRGILTMMMTECSREFERLPILENVDILRNILYSGVWFRYWQVVKRRKEEREKQ